MKYIGNTNEYFEIMNISKENCEALKSSKESELSLLWFDTDENIIIVDSVEHTFNKNEIVCFTEFHKLEIKKINGLKLLRFNKPFYCILDHDSEVGCKGILFFAAASFAHLKPDSKDVEVLETVWKMIILEMQSRDNLQLEMLQMMLKRLLILATRIYKAQSNFEQIENSQMEIVREYNFLVEQHFRKEHSVGAYAAMLAKSPKTLSNIFKKLGSKTPLQFIQERIMLEARRLLRYTDLTISEIGYEIGYEDIQSFSRFFKKQEGVSPSEFKEISFEGNIANS